MTKLKPEDAPGRFKLKERIADGIWIDMDNHVHFSIEELRIKFDLPDTPEVKQRMDEICMEIAKQKNPNIQFVKRDHPDDWKNI